MFTDRNNSPGIQRNLDQNNTNMPPANSSTSSVGDAASKKNISKKGGVGTKSKIASGNDKDEGFERNRKPHQRLVQDRQTQEFPGDWDAHFQSLHEKGKEDLNKLSTTDIRLLYPGAWNRLDADKYTKKGGKQLLIDHVQQWKQRPATLGDVHVAVQDICKATLDTVQATAERIEDKSIYEYDKLWKSHEDLQAQIDELRAQNKQADATAREIVINEPAALQNKLMSESWLDHEKDPNWLKKAAVELLKPLYSTRGRNGLEEMHLLNVRRLFSDGDKVTRWKVITATVEIKQEIETNGKRDPAFRGVLRGGMTFAQRQVIKNRFDYDIVCKHFNWCSMSDKTKEHQDKMFCRVNRVSARGQNQWELELLVATDKRISRTAERAAKGELYEVKQYNKAKLGHLWPDSSMPDQ